MKGETYMEKIISFNLNSLSTQQLLDLSDLFRIASKRSKNWDEEDEVFLMMDEHGDPTLKINDRFVFFPIGKAKPELE